jgi:hypothetical protein
VPFKFAPDSAFNLNGVEGIIGGRAVGALGKKSVVFALGTFSGFGMPPRACFGFVRC